MAKKSGQPERDPLGELRKLDREMRARRVAPVPSPAPPPGEIERRYDDVVDVAASLASTFNLRGILDRIVDGVIRVTRCERGFVILLEPDGQLAMYTGRTRDHAEWDERSARAISGTIVDRVKDTHSPFIGTELETMDGLSEADSILVHKIRAAVCLPLLYMNELIGVIYADSGFVIPRFLDVDRAMLLALSLQAALAIESARRQGELEAGHERLATQNVRLRQQIAREFSLSKMISRSPRMRDVFETVQKLAPHDITVLIEGESGTGKELLARAIHEASRRRERPFEAINCALIPGELVASVLFGHVRGTFTSADSDRVGLFEIASGGTLFLDEIGDMPAKVQVAMLRVLQEGVFSRLGEEGKLRKADVRIVAATHVDVVQRIKEGAFREDLYYRLLKARISLPPLRERPEDIIPLAEQFLAQYADERKEPHAKLSPEARAVLLACAWPGNVRQLRSVVEYGYALKDERCTVHASAIQEILSSQGRDSGAADEPEDASLREMVDRYEEKLVRRALAAHGGKAAAARALGISRQHLYEKMKKYGIPVQAE